MAPLSGATAITHMRKAGGGQISKFSCKKLICKKKASTSFGDENFKK